MKFPEECLRSCMQVCRGFSDSERSVWLVSVLVCIAGSFGFVVGRFNVNALLKDIQRVLSSSRNEPRAALQQLCEILVSSSSAVRQHIATQVRTDKSKHGRLIRKTSLEQQVLQQVVQEHSMQASRSSKHSVKEAMGGSGGRNDDSPQASPNSSNSSSSGSFKKEKLSPLLVGSKGSSPSSLENSPGRKRDMEIDELVTEAAGSGETSSKPSPLSIPTLNFSSSGTPRLVSPMQSQMLLSDDTIPAAAWMCGTDVANEHECGIKWLDLIAVNLEGVFGEDWSRNVHPDDIVHCKEVITLAISLKEPFQMEYRLQVRHDRHRWVLDIGKPRLASSSGDFVGFVGWRIDIHERKTIENNYWKYWTLPHEYLVNWSGDGRFFDNVSPAFPCFLGYTAEEFMATEWMDLVHDEDKASTREAFAALKEGKAVVSLINRFRCKNDKVGDPSYTDSTGAYKWLNWTASHMFAACRDITADQLAREELRRSQKELQRITDVIPGGVFLYRVTKDGIESFPYLSKGALNLLNVDMKEVASEYNTRRVFGLNVHPNDWPRLESEMINAVSLQAPLDHDYRILKSEGIRWIRVHAVPKSDSNGTVEWSGIAWDITEQHELLDTLKEARDIAERAAQANRKFLAHMSHEIRTPMNAVIGMGALLLETDLTDEQREYACTIRSSGEALLGIINDILDYSKIEAGKMELEIHPTDILQCVEESFDLVAPQAVLKSLELTYNVCDTLPGVVLGDSTRIRQILVNLLSNAVKFTESGSISVNVEGRLLEDARFPSKNGHKAAYRSKQNLWEIEFSVSDSGIGIPEDRRNSLFQAFSQVDTSTTRRYGGTGLGLAICSRLCALHGGRIWVADSTKGSTFFFTIVAEEVPKYHSIDTDEPEAPSNLRNKRVLIVAGSSSSTQTMCARLLKSWHMRPVCASSSDEALLLLRQMVETASIVPSRLTPRKEKSPLAFDAVIFDCSLLDAEDAQVMECLDLCHTALQTVPTLLLTPFGRRNQEYHSGKQPVHFDSYVSKPVKESHLFNALANLIIEIQDDEQDGFSEYCRVPPAAASSKKSTKAVPVGTPSKISDVGKIYPLRILVAEDNLINQKVILKLLLRLGYTADVVGNGREALETVSRHTYDVILMDCFMPEMDGLEASRRIRETIKPTPVIVAVTAAALEEEMQACLQAGMHMYISKPIQSDELMHTLGKCWQMRQES